MAYIYKNKGSTTEMKNYRPITVLNVFYKIYTSAMQKKISDIIQDTIPDNQFGFRARSGCRDYLNIVNDITSNVQIKDLSIAMLDLTQAFDRVNRKKIWISLRKMGVPDSFTELIWKTHQETTVLVSWEGEQSALQKIDRGVFQGSPISPQLFLIAAHCFNVKYTRLCEEKGLGKISMTKGEKKNNTSKFWEKAEISLKEINKDGEIKLHYTAYADDTMLYAENMEELVEKIKIFQEVAEEDNMKLNMAKTKIATRQEEFTKDTKKRRELNTKLLKLKGKQTGIGKNGEVVGGTFNIKGYTRQAVLHRKNAGKKVNNALMHTFYKEESIDIKTKITVQNAVQGATSHYCLEAMRATDADLNIAQELQNATIKKIVDPKGIQRKKEAYRKQAEIKKLITEILQAKQDGKWTKEEWWEKEEENEHWPKLKGPIEKRQKEMEIWLENSKETNKEVKICWKTREEIEREANCATVASKWRRQKLNHAADIWRKGGIQLEKEIYQWDYKKEEKKAKNMVKLGKKENSFDEILKDLEERYEKFRKILIEETGKGTKAVEIYSKLEEEGNFIEPEKLINFKKKKTERKTGPDAKTITWFRKNKFDQSWKKQKEIWEWITRTILRKYARNNEFGREMEECKNCNKFFAGKGGLSSHWQATWKKCCKNDNNIKDEECCAFVAAWDKVDIEDEKEKWQNDDILECPFNTLTCHCPNDGRRCIRCKIRYGLTEENIKGRRANKQRAWKDKLQKKITGKDRLPHEEHIEFICQKPDTKKKTEQ